MKGLNRVIRVKTTYCRLCGTPAGASHEPWCPRNEDVQHTHEK